MWRRGWGGERDGRSYDEAEAYCVFALLSRYMESILCSGPDDGSMESMHAR